MNQREETKNQLPEENNASITENYPLETPENEIVYIAELNGEFFTVDYNQEEGNPTVTPLKIVEFMTPVKETTQGQLASVESNLDGELQPLDSSEPISPLSSSEEPKLSTNKLSTNKSLALGVALGLLIALGATKLITSQSTPEPVATDAPTEVTPSSPPRSVTVEPAKTSTVDRIIEVSGTAEALELIPVTSQVTGLQIEEILVDEGSEVTTGQILAKLKDDTIQAEYQQAQAAVDGAKARLAELQAGTRNEEIARAEERVKRAIAGVKQAESDLELISKRVERNSGLQAEGAISRDRLDEIKNQERISSANLDQAEATLQEANQELKQLKTGARPEVIEQAKAELAKAQGQLQYASVQLENTDIRSAANGIIAERNAKVGDLTSPSQTLFTIIENGSLELRLQVPETDLSRIRPGQPVKITNTQNSSEPIVGKIREIDPIVNSESRQAIVKVNLPSGTTIDSPLSRPAVTSI